MSPLSYGQIAPTMLLVAWNAYVLVTEMGGLLKSASMRFIITEINWLSCNNMTVVQVV